jgi:crossover junction endodeoxyribonuclease RuvC
LRVVFFGIDPGTAATGYGAIQAEGNRITWLDSGIIAPPSGGTLSEKLEAIYDGLCGLLARLQPAVVSIEQAFYAKNVHTTLILGHARGVAMLAAHKAEAAVMEFSPREIKKSLVGNGNASKDQVAFMIQTLLSPPATHAQTDACDALAAAMCGFYNHRSALRPIPAPGRGGSVSRRRTGRAPKGRRHV